LSSNKLIVPNNIEGEDWVSAVKYSREHTFALRRQPNTNDSCGDKSTVVFGEIWEIPLDVKCWLSIDSKWKIGW